MPKVITKDFEEKNYSNLQKRLLRAMKFRNCNKICDLAALIYKNNSIPTCTQTSIEQKIKGYLKEAYSKDEINEKKGCSIQDIIAYSKALNVSTDYLLGLTDVMSTDITIKEICSKYNFDEKAMEKLLSEINSQYKEWRWIEKDKIKVLNILLSSDEFYKCIDSFCNWSKLHNSFKEDSLSKRQSAEEILGKELYDKAYVLDQQLKSRDPSIDSNNIDDDLVKAMDLINQEECEEYKSEEKKYKNELEERVMRFDIDECSRRLNDKVIAALKNTQEK